MIITTNKLINQEGKVFLFSLCSRVLSMVRLLNLSRFVVERSHIFNLQAAENNRSSAALFAAFTRRSLQTVMFVQF